VFNWFNSRGAAGGNKITTVLENKNPASGEAGGIM